MSKRNKKPPVKFPVQTPLTAQQMMDRYRAANQQMHNINVSTPILMIIQRLVNDAKFREDITRRMTQQ